MNDILQDLSTPNLITAIETNQYALLSAARSWPRVQVHDTPEILWFMTDIPSPLFNSVLRAELAPDRIDPAIESVIAEARARHVPLLWWTGPATQPDDLDNHLMRHGFESAGQLPGMAVDALGFQQYCTIGHYLWSPEPMQGTGEHAAL